LGNIGEKNVKSGNNAKTIWGGAKATKKKKKKKKKVVISRFQTQKQKTDND
jgi:hypothetical protein